MTELQNDPAVKKIIEYGKSKKHITYDELNDLLPSEMSSSDKIDEIIEILEKNDITLEESEDDFDEEEDDEDDEEKSSSMSADDKDGIVDDPIRLYLREIGKETLLTAEQEVILSKQMEEGGNILKRVIPELLFLKPTGCLRRYSPGQMQTSRT